MLIFSNRSEKSFLIRHHLNKDWKIVKELAKGSSICKGPGVGECSRYREEASVIGAE